MNTPLPRPAPWRAIMAAASLLAGAGCATHAPLSDHDHFQARQDFAQDRQVTSQMIQAIERRVSPLPDTTR